MFCSKCGKEIDTGIICYECYQKEQMEIMLREKERNEKREREEAERLEKERLERERIEKERLERERIEKERLERERVEQKNTVEADPVVNPTETYTPPTSPSPNPVKANNTMVGFGAALTSAILGFVGYIFAVVYYVLPLVTMAIVFDDAEAVFVGSTVGNIFFTIPLSIISLILGIKSIKLFKSTSGKRPIPALILGISAVSFSGLSFIFVFITLILSSVIA